MIRIIVLSDTHKNQSLLRKVLQNEIEQCNYVFHLGDNYEDLDENEDLLIGKKVTRVPGIFHPRYLDGSLPAGQIVKVLNWSFMLVHNIDDIPEILPNHHIFCYGHTHRLELKKIDGHYFLNPGHLKDEWDKDRPASYVILDVEIDKIVIEFKDKSGVVIQKHIIDRYDQ
ncbi:MAG: metallophosphatase family protein [Candidatus Cloacimonetes bacterium]|nr:metallophosphatase family protein [Candidatus Cloacimonadota bacterium]